MFLFFRPCLVKFLPKPQDHLSLWPWFLKHSQTEPTPECNYQKVAHPFHPRASTSQIIVRRLTTPQPSCHST